MNDSWKKGNKRQCLVGLDAESQMRIPFMTALPEYGFLLLAAIIVLSTPLPVLAFWVPSPGFKYKNGYISSFLLYQGNQKIANANKKLSMVLRDPSTSPVKNEDKESAKKHRAKEDRAVGETDDDDEHDFMIWKANASDALGSMLVQLQSSFQPSAELAGPLQDKDDARNNSSNMHDSKSTTAPRQQKTVSKQNSNTMAKSLKQREAPSGAPGNNSIVAAFMKELSAALGTKDDINDKPKEGRINQRSQKDDDPPATVTSFSPPSLFAMTLETAKELDDAVSTKISVKDQSEDIIQIMQVPSFLFDTSKPPTTTQEQELEKTELSRNLRQLAISIASRTESVKDWCQVVSPQIGGIYPLLETIRYGAQTVMPSNNNDADVTGLEEDGGDDPLWEEASRACRALRDLCALSPELAAVLVDSMLRANQSYKSKYPEGKGGLLQDLCHLLQYASRDIAIPDRTSNAAKQTPRQWLVRALRRSRHRRRRRLGGLVSPQESSDNPGAADGSSATTRSINTSVPRQRRVRRRKYCQLYVTQLLLAMAVASDDAVHAIRACPQLKDAVLQCSSYARKERRRRWLRYPVELGKWLWYEQSGKVRKRRLLRKQQAEKHDGTIAVSKDTLPENEQSSEQEEHHRRPFLEAASLANDLHGEICKTANQVLAAIGCNQWIPKIPGQKGLRILTLDGGGSRGMASVTAVRCLVEAAGPEICESFDMICGTSTGGIIAFLTGLRQESSADTMARYNQLIRQIFVKSALSTPLLLFTTASYDESPFMGILSSILKDAIMLDSRSDPATPLVFAVASKMSSTPTHVVLFRNYNYANGELPDPFTIRPDHAREQLELALVMEHPDIRYGEYKSVRDPGNTDGRLPNQRPTTEGSRHPGSFRVLQRYALRASTAAPTFFKPVMMGGEMYCDGGMVTSNPTAVAIHEARALFPDIPIELVVSIGTGCFYEQKSAPIIGWDGIIGQIVDSATDGEQVHHILEDILGESTAFGQRSPVSGTRYFRFNPVIGYPDEFPIDVTEPEKLEKLKQITRDYMKQPAQRAKLEEISDILKGQSRWKVSWPR